MAETKSSAQVGAKVQMPSPPKEVMPAVRASRAGSRSGMAPGHSLPR